MSKITLFQNYDRYTEIYLNDILFKVNKNIYILIKL